MPSTTLSGSTGVGSGIYGAVPGVTSPNSTASTAISGNIANLSDLYNLAGSQNTFNNQQALSGLSSNLPGYTGLVNQSSQNIANNLAGVISPDVKNQIANAAAERGVSGGFGVDSANTNAALLRAMGLTSMGLQQTGENQLTGAIGRTPTAQLFNMTPYMTSASDQQAAQQAANVYASSPDPTAQAIAEQNAAKTGLKTGSGMGGGQGQQNQGTAFQPTFGSGGGNEGFAIGRGSGQGGYTSPTDLTSNWWQQYGGRNTGVPGDEFSTANLITGLSDEDAALLYGDQGTQAQGGDQMSNEEFNFLFGDGGGGGGDYTNQDFAYDYGDGG